MVKIFMNNQVTDNNLTICLLNAIWNDKKKKNKAYIDLSYIRSKNKSDILKRIINYCSHNTLLHTKSNYLRLSCIKSHLFLFFLSANEQIATV